MVRYMTLNDIKVGESAIVTDILAGESMKNRFYDLGLVEGTRVSCEIISPLGDPVGFQIRGALIAIRREDAKGISVELCECEKEGRQNASAEVEDENN